MWATAAGAAAALAPILAARRRTFDGRPWTRGFTIVTGAVVLSTLVSFAFSPSHAHALTWWGSGLRRFGALTEIALACAAAAIAIVAGRPSAFKRLVTAFVVGSVGPTLYGMSQFLGIDPWRAGTPLWERPGGTFGNPLWLAGYLAAALPITVAYAAYADGRWQRRAGAVLAVLQMTGLAATRSRGPAAAIAAAALSAGAMLFASRGWGRSAVATALATLLAAGIVTVVVALTISSASLDSKAAQSRDDRGRATVAVRLLLWRAAANGIGARRFDLIFGAGPESMSRVLTGYAGAAAKTLEGPEEVPDRSHNDTLDRLGMFGVVGLTAHVLMIAIALAAALAALALVSSSQSRRFAAFACAVLAAIVTTGWLLGGVSTLAVALPVACVMVPCAWILRRTPVQIGGDTERTVWIVAATASWLAHTIDVHTSIASVASALAGSTALGFAVACADRPPSVSPRTPKPAATSTRRGPADKPMHIVVGLVAILMFEASTPGSFSTPASWALAATSLLLAQLVAGGRGRSLAIAVAAILVFAAVWLSIGGTPGPLDQHWRAADTRIATLAATMAAALALLAWQLASKPSSARATIGILAGATATAAFGFFAVHTSMVEVVLAAAGACEERGDLACARAGYQHVLAVDDSDPRALTRLARTLMRQADAIGSPGLRQELYDTAAASFTRAALVDPFDYHHPRNRGALERRLARQSLAAERTRHLAIADSAYADAIALAPTNPTLWMERANLDLEEQRPDDALRTLERAATLGASPDTTMLVGDAVLAGLSIDVGTRGGAQAAASALRTRGLDRLAALYAARGSGRDGDR